MADTYSFSQWLEQEMKNRDLTQSELARRAGVTRAAINGVLTGGRTAGNDLLNAIARGLRLPPELVFRAAGILPPAPDENEDLILLNHLFSKLSEEDREDVLAIIETKIKRQEERDQTRQRRPGKYNLDSQ